MNGNIHRGIRRFCSILIGATFLISGMLKAMDPVGTGLIVGEYLKFLHLNFLNVISNLVSIALIICEIAVAVLMMFGVFRRFTALFSGAVIAFFTIISLILLIFNPEMECGCFGEAIPLTHLQTFIKNIVLAILWAITIFPFSMPGTPKKRKYIGFGIVCIGIFGFVFYSFRGIPLVDFTEFAPGTELLAAQNEEFIEEGEDLSGQVVSVLSISDAFGEYQDKVAAEGNVMLATVYEPEKMSEKAWGKVSAVLQNAQYAGMKPVLLCSSFDSVPVELSDLVYFSDYKTLVTLNRSNGGFTYLSDGRIITKWSWREGPDADRLNRVIERNPLDVMMTSDTRKRLTFQTYLLFSFLVMLFV